MEDQPLWVGRHWKQEAGQLRFRLPPLQIEIAFLGTLQSAGQIASCRSSNKWWPFRTTPSQVPSFGQRCRSDPHSMFRLQSYSRVPLDQGGSLSGWKGRPSEGGKLTTTWYQAMKQSACSNGMHTTFFSFLAISTPHSFSATKHVIPLYPFVGSTFANIRKIEASAAFVFNLDQCPMKTTYHPHLWSV